MSKTITKKDVYRDECACYDIIKRTFSVPFFSLLQLIKSLVF